MPRLPHQLNRNRDRRAGFANRNKASLEIKSLKPSPLSSWAGVAVLDFSLYSRETCASAGAWNFGLCATRVPRTRQARKGANGTGIASGAADHPKFLSLTETVFSKQLSAISGGMPGNAQGFFITEDWELRTEDFPMSYQVIARKWRPQTFDDLVGQQHVTETLKTRSRMTAWRTPTFFRARAA